MPLSVSGKTRIGSHLGAACSQPVPWTNDWISTPADITSSVESDGMCLLVSFSRGTVAVHKIAPHFCGVVASPVMSLLIPVGMARTLPFLKSATYSYIRKVGSYDGRDNFRHRRKRSSLIQLDVLLAHQYFATFRRKELSQRNS
jgi:hypothetical protein